MAFEFHKDKVRYFNQQKENAHKYVIPFVEQSRALKPGSRVMEIGCAEGGVLKAFLERGCYGIGVELQENRYKNALEFLAEDIAGGQAEMINRNIYDVDFAGRFEGTLDLIILKDVIEHIHDQEKLMHQMHTLLKPDGQIFFGFPPWYMPFGGHQQVCESKFLSKLPYFHLLPNFMYRGVLKMFGERPIKVTNLMEIKETGISLERFERIVKNTNYQIDEKTLFLINPIYKYKFGLKPRKQIWPLGSIPFIKNFVTTCGYYLIRKVNT